MRYWTIHGEWRSTTMILVDTFYIPTSFLILDLSILSITDHKIVCILNTGIAWSTGNTLAERHLKELRERKTLQVYNQGIIYFALFDMKNIASSL